MTDREQQKRGLEAKAVLENAVYQDAWLAVRSRLTEIMATARTDEATLHAKVMIGLLTDVQSFMVRALNEGKIATAAIELEAKKEAERKKWWQRAA